MVLAELPGRVPLRLEQSRERWIFFLHALRRAGQADLCEAGADRRLAGDERRATRGAALLAVPVGEDRAFTANAIDVGRLVAHHAHVVRADIELSDIVTPDDQDVWLARRDFERLHRLTCDGGIRRVGRHRATRENCECESQV